MGEQRYIGETESAYFEIEDWFVEQLAILKISKRKLVLDDILSALSYLPVVSGWSQTTAGVVRGDEAFFYTFEYLNESDNPLLLLDVQEIEVDQYLDMILENNTIEYYVKTNP